MHLETWSRSAKSLGLMAFRCNTAIRRCSNRAPTSYLTPPGRTNDDGTVIPALQGARLHDLRRTFATLQLSPGVHFMQACKWLGHRTFTLTRTPRGSGSRGRWRGCELAARADRASETGEAIIMPSVVSIFSRRCATRCA